MEKDIIYLEGAGQKVGEKELCKIIISQFSRGNDSVKKNMISYHMDEIKSVSSLIVKTLGGNFVSARSLNMCFYESLRSLGFTVEQLMAPKNRVDAASYHF